MRTLLSSVTIRQWCLLGIFNLVLVAAFGLLMRSAVIFPQTWFNQKYILHAHSHFAFSGWISHMLMVLMAMLVLNKKAADCLPKKYQLLIGANMLASYGMLFCFSWQGYGRYSIIFSTLTILLSYGFVGILLHAIARSTLSLLVRKWFRAALLFLLVSSLGTFYLAYLQATHNVDGNKQLFAIYFFLHFQYNGWFFFSCMGLWQHWLASRQIEVAGGSVLYHVFAWTCAPAYLLSLLWLDLPVELYVVLVLAVLAQNFSWFYWLKGLLGQIKWGEDKAPSWLGGVLLCILSAVSLKVLLQGIALTPAFHELTYSFRPIVVGYLHLVLLGIITLFILVVLFLNKIVCARQWTKWTMLVFICGIIVNELVLLVQGLSGMQGIYIPHLPMGLMLAALVMFISLALLWISTVWSLRKE